MAAGHVAYNAGYRRMMWLEAGRGTPPPNSWPGNEICLMKVVLFCLLVLPAFATAAAETDTATGLIQKPGWEEVRAQCGGCHSYGLITNQRGNRQTWEDMIRWMQRTQNLWALPVASEVAILDYLAEHYPAVAGVPHRRKPLPAALLPKREGLARTDTVRVPEDALKQPRRTSRRPPGGGGCVRRLVWRSGCR